MTASTTNNNYDLATLWLSPTKETAHNRSGKSLSKSVSKSLGKSLGENSGENARKGLSKIWAKPE